MTPTKYKLMKNTCVVRSLAAAAVCLMAFLLFACAAPIERDSVARLMAIQEIEQLRARFVNAVDNRRWNELRDEILAADVMVDLPATIVDKSASPELRERLSGADTFIAFARGLIGDKPGGNHSSTNPVIEITSSTTAKGLWRMGTASYYDTYEEAGGRWRIKTIRFEPNVPGPL